MPKKNEPMIQNEPDEKDSSTPQTGEKETEGKEEGKAMENPMEKPTGCPAAEYDPWEIVPLMVERDPTDENTNMVIGINGKNYVMPRGKVSNVPRCVYDEYQRAKAAQYQADATIAELSGIKAAQRN